MSFKPCSTAAFIIALKGLFKISQILKIFLKYFIFKRAMFKNKKIQMQIRFKGFALPRISS